MSDVNHGFRAGEDDGDDDICPLCSGDGVIMASDAGPGFWGEDCFCEEDHLVSCPECAERERYQAMADQMEAARVKETKA